MRILAALVLLASALTTWTVSAEGLRTIALAPGVSEKIEFATDVGSAYIANPETADVNVLDPRNLFLLGVAPGITSLKVHDIEGTLLAAYTVRVDVQTDHARTVVAKVLGDAADVAVDAVGDALFVSGTVKSAAQAERLLRGIRAVSSAPVVDALDLDTPAQVNLEVLISEVSRNVTNELGIDWSLDMNPFLIPLRTWATGAGTRLGTGALQLANIYDQVVSWSDPETGATVYSNEVQELGITLPTPRDAEGGIVLSHSEIVNRGEHRVTAFLETLAQNGLGVVHARPTLTTVSGAPAEFFSGLEVPVPTISDRGVVATEYRQTGVSLTFTPVVVDPDHISLAVQPRIRELAAGGATIAGAVVPNINERSASTTVELGDGESIAIAGLYRRTTTAADGGVPLLKDIPVWGALFRTSRETDNSVELIIVVTPRIVAGVAPQPIASRTAPGAASRKLDNEFHY